MVESISAYLRETAALLEATASADLEASVERAATCLASALVDRKPVLICGNGGSAADAQHIAGELVGRYLLERPAYKAIALGADTAVLTAWSNDYSYESAFAREVEALGEPGGVLWAISTSGNSANVLAALEAARRIGMTTLGLTGAGGGRMRTLCDILLDVPSRSTPRIQEVHHCLYHFLCGAVERHLSGSPAKKN